MSLVEISKLFKCKIVIISLPISLNIFFGVLKKEHCLTEVGKN